MSAGSARLCAPGSLGQQAGRSDWRSGRAANGSPRARLRRSVPGASPSWARAPAIITGARSDVSRTRAPPPPPRGVLENCGARTRAHAHAHALSLPRPPRAGNVPASPACLPARAHTPRPAQPGTAVVPTRTRTAAPRPPQCAQQPPHGVLGARSTGKGHGHRVDHLGWALQVAAPTKGCSHLPFLSLEGPGLVPKGPTTPHVRTSGPVRLLQSSLGRKAPEPSCGLPVVFVPHACAGTLSSCPLLPASRPVPTLSEVALGSDPPHLVPTRYPSLSAFANQDRGIRLAKVSRPLCKTLPAECPSRPGVRLLLPPPPPQTLVETHPSAPWAGPGTRGGWLQGVSKGSPMDEGHWAPVAAASTTDSVVSAETLGSGGRPH